MVDVAAVAVAFAVRLIVLGRVGDDIGEREAVVRGDEIDRSRRRAEAGREDVGRAGEARRQLADASRLAAPEPAHRVAIVVVPFAPAGRELPETIAARPDIPRLGNELQLAQHGILLDGLEQRRRGVETVGAPAERGREVEAKSVHAGDLGVVAKRVEREAQRRRPVERHRVAATGVVDIARPVVGKVR